MCFGTDNGEKNLDGSAVCCFAKKIHVRRYLNGISWAYYRYLSQELQSYFASPLAYAIAGIFWLLSGFFFVIILLGPEGIIQQVVRNDLQGAKWGTSFRLWMFPYEFAGVLNLLGSLALFVLPILSMGLYAEERRGTLELLATSPVTNWAVAVGKLLLTFFYYNGATVTEAIALSAASPPVQPAVYY